jgi:5-dehydro-2-deoxygluconokinase
MGAAKSLARQMVEIDGETVPALGGVFAIFGEWPADHCIKLLCSYNPDAAAELKAKQVDKLVDAFDAARKIGREVLIEILCSKAGAIDDDTMARTLTDFYDAGLDPDWWKLEPQLSAAAWEAIDTVIETRDPLCRGVLLLGLDAKPDDLKTAFKIAKGARTMKGFAVGRTIFGDAVRACLTGGIDHNVAIADMADGFAALRAAWEDA